jgi:hypothetical protein
MNVNRRNASPEKIQWISFGDFLDKLPVRIFPGTFPASRVQKG